MNEVVEEIKFNGSSEPYVKLEEMAKILRIKPETIADWVRRYEDFPHLDLPGNIRLRPSEVESWLKTFKPAPRGRPPKIEAGL